MGVSANRSSKVEESLRGVTIRLSRPRGERYARARATQRAKRPERDPGFAIDASRVRRVRSATRRRAPRAFRYAPKCAARVPIRAKVCRARDPLEYWQKRAHAEYSTDSQHLGFRV